MVIEQIEIVSAVERLGGWAVVVWVVWWMTRRWESQTQKQWSVIKDLVDAMNQHRNDERLHREKMISRLDALNVNLSRKESA